MFGTLAEQPSRSTTWLGAAPAYLDEHIDRHPGGRLRVLPSALTLEYRGNWKLAWDNAADGLHATFAHRSYNELGRAADDARPCSRATRRARRCSPRRSATVTWSSTSAPASPTARGATMRPLPFAEAIEARSRRLGDDADAELDLAAGNMVNLSLFPNLILVGNQLMVVEPLAVDRTRLHLHLVLADGADEEVNLLRLRVDEDFVSFGTPDDLEMFERIQEGLSIPEVPWIDISRGIGAPATRIGRTAC